MKGVALERFDAGDAGQLWFGHRASRSDQVARDHFIATIGLDRPLFSLVIPRHIGGHRLQQRVAIEIEFARDLLGMFPYFGSGGVFLAWHAADFFEQRQIDIGFHIAGCARIAVPIPGAADIATAFDNADIFDADPAQFRRAQQSAIAAADDDDVHLLPDRIARKMGVGIGIFVKLAEFALKLDIGSGAAFLGDALFALIKVLFAKRNRVEPKCLQVRFC